ncbi:MAG: trimethylamine methyltransferase family protein [Desulfatirhabdiaceae bacterium]
MTPPVSSSRVGAADYRSKQANLLASDGLYSVNDFFRKEHGQPRLCNRRTLENWQAVGEKNWADVAMERTRDILACHGTIPLDSDAQSSLNNLRKQAEIDMKRVRFGS